VRAELAGSDEETRTEKASADLERFHRLVVPEGL